MPRVASGTKDQMSGTTGKLQVIADRVSDKLLDATEWRPEAIRVVLTLQTDPEKEVSWAVPIESPDLRPYSTLVPQGEPALRRALNGALDTRPRWVDVYNNFVNHFLAPPGEHIGTLDDFHQFTRKSDGALRCSFRLVTKEGLVSQFTTPWPAIECRKGETPEGDWMGPEKELNEGTGPFPYLCTLGLDWKRWTDVELEQAVALFDGHFAENMDPIKSYFQDIDDLTPEIFAAVKRHGLKPVQWEVVPHDTFTLSITRGQFFFELTPVVVEGDESFQAVKIVFLELWENFSRVLLEKPKLEFLIQEGEDEGKPTEDAKTVIRGVLVPLIRAYPDTVKLFRDGVPKAGFPVKREDWRTNGLAVLSFVAERLMAEQELFQIVNLDDPASLLAWCEENVKELRDDMSVDEGEEF